MDVNKKRRREFKKRKRRDNDRDNAFVVIVRVLWFLVFILALQQIEGQFIYPRVVGNSIGLPGLLVLIAVILGGGLGGIFGIIFTVPVFAIIYQLLKEAIDHMPEDDEPEPALAVVGAPSDTPPVPEIIPEPEQPEPAPAAQTVVQSMQKSQKKRRKRKH